LQSHRAKPVDPVAVARGMSRDPLVQTAIGEWASALDALLDLSERVLHADGRVVLSHNDLNPSNILWDGARVWLID